VELVKEIFAVSIVFISVLYFIMEKSPFGSLFGNTTATITVVDEPPPAQLDPFKIPMKIVERVMNNSYSGDGTVHSGDHLLFIHELCDLFKCAGISTSEFKRKLFSLSLKGRATEWYRLLKDVRSVGWEEIVPLFYSKFYPPSEIHKDRNRIYNFWPHDCGDPRFPIRNTRYANNSRSHDQCVVNPHI
jgi:hypothetical protein